MSIPMSDWVMCLYTLETNSCIFLLKGVKKHCYLDSIKNPGEKSQRIIYTKSSKYWGEERMDKLPLTH